MKRLLALLMVTAAALTWAAESPPETTAIISNVTVVDGTGAPARKGAVRIAGNRIVAVGDLLPEKNEIIIDGGGKVLAPGFIDTHSHHDADIAESRDMVAVTSQGVTTIIVGQDGKSPSPLADFYTKIDESPIAVNIGSYSGHNTLREQGMNAARRAATDEEVARMSQLLEEDLAAGAFGLSTGLVYETGNFSTPAEVLALAKVSASHGGRYISHIRNEGFELMPALQEVIEIGRQTGMPVHVSHLKIAAKRLWGTSDKVLTLLNDARASGVDITADVYPYTYWQSTMRVMFPHQDYSDRKGLAFMLMESTPPDGLHFVKYAPDPTVVGETLAEIAKERGGHPVDVYLDLMKKVIDYENAHPDEERVEAIVGKSMHEDDIIRFMTWEHSNICSDGMSLGHPRGHGTFPRVLGHYVREKKVMTLEQAVHKMTGLAAKHLGITDRGTLAPGSAADLVLFDPETIMDRATLEKPTTLSSGIEKVWVNGKLVFQERRTTGVRPGVIVRAAKGAGS
ncbi:MAG TPA: D-aminoacylase [Steroidobacter sp.]|uniref:N-acyl-D-amino-acid deacylase family protein n=1 Tax=Steroidobacter sp. TaxID=1978227 RepID=UPI002ED87179